MTNEESDAILLRARRSSLETTDAELERKIAGSGKTKAQFRREREADRQRILNILHQRGGGSVLRGWRRELDPDGSLDLNYHEFVRSCARLGVDVDVMRLLSLDGQPSSLSLSELIPEEGGLVERFRQWLKEKFGGPIGMFTAFADDQNRFTKDMFIKRCRSHGFDATQKELLELYHFLDEDDQGSVTQDEVMFLEIDPHLRELEIFKYKMKSKHQQERMLAYVYWDDGRRDFHPRHRLARRPWLAGNFEKLPALQCEARIDRQHEAMWRTAEALAAFHSHLKKTYGNEVRAWRRALDKNRKFAVTRAELSQYCRAVDLNIDIGVLWKSLDKDGDNYITLTEYNPKCAVLLAQFQHWVRERFGSCAALWECPEVVDLLSEPQGGGRWVSNKKLLMDNLTAVLKAVGWKSDNSSSAGSSLGTMLDYYGCGFVSREDLEWLDRWQPPGWLCSEPDPKAWQELRVLMLKAYDLPLRAWRKLLDTDDTNQVCWSEFERACRKLGFKGNVGGAWRHLDADNSGTISMREYDQESADLLSSFKEWAEYQFASVELAFKAIDADGSGSITLSELKRACRRFKWQGNVKLLFHCLDTDNDSERRTLQYKELEFLDAWEGDYSASEQMLEDTIRLIQEREVKRRVRPSTTSSAPVLGLARDKPEPAGSENNSNYSGSQRPFTSESGATMDSRNVAKKPMSKAETLHRRYHCLAAKAKRRKNPEAPERLPRRIGQWMFTETPM